MYLDSSTDHRRRADARRNRDAIIAAAASLLVEQPDASMEAIARVAGVGRATVYRHFAAREDLERTIRMQAMVEAENALEGAVGRDEDAASAIAGATRALLAVGDRYRLLSQNDSLDPRDAERIAREQAIGERLTALFERGRAEGLIDRDVSADWALRAFGALLIGALREMAAGVMTIDEGARAVTRTLLSGLAPR